jgi:two-component system response regulator HydG
VNLEGSEQAGAARTVLIVEDDESVAELVQFTLARENFDVAVVHDCASARAEVETTDHDLVFLDLKLPDGDGLDLLSWIKDRGGSSAVIVMTAFRQEDKALRAYDLGAVDFICKPFKPKELLTRARHVLGASQGSGERRGV